MDLSRILLAENQEIFSNLFGLLRIYELYFYLQKCSIQTFTGNWVSKQNFFFFDIDNRLENMFFRNIFLVLFFKIESRNF